MKKRNSSYYDQYERNAHLESVDFLNRLISCDRQALSEALSFLYRDPYFFRSGYIKGALIQHLKQIDLRSNDHYQAKAIILKIVCKPPLREFKYYCRWAAIILDADLHGQLQEIADSNAMPMRSNARYMLQYLAQTNAHYQKLIQNS